MPIFSLEFDDPLFCAAFHPEKNEFVLGFATGTVSAYRYTTDGQNPEVIWSTKRHKSSCRSIGYTQDGEYVISAGSDNVIKKALSGSGKVRSKAKLDVSPSAMAINEAYLAVGDDEGTLTVFDLENLKQTHQFESVHEDCITSVCALEFKNKYHFVVTGMTCLVHVDLRNGIVSTSEDQEDEMLCGCVASDQKSVFGMSEGVITIWNNDHLLDQQNRVRLSKESVDAVLAGEEEDTVVAGTSDGMVFDVNIISGKVVGKRTHSTLEEVSILDWDNDYHLVSGSMGLLKLWNKGEVDPEVTEADTIKKKKKGVRGKGKSAQPNKKPKALFEDL